MILNYVWLRSGCNNRSKDGHSFLRKSRFFVFGDFSSRQFRRIVYSSEIIQNLCFSRILEINFTKTCMHACKILQVLPKSKQNSPKVVTGVTPDKTRISRNHFRRSKSLRASRTRARPHAHAHAVYILI